MKTTELLELEKPTQQGTNLVQMPFGLLGFEAVKNYLLITHPQEEPFQWLQMMDGPKKAFLVVSPFVVHSDYQPDISDEDMRNLELADASDATVFVICTLRPNEVPTVNLKGPIVMNRHTFIAKQCIPDNASLYSLRHPVPVS